MPILFGAMSSLSPTFLLLPHTNRNSMLMFASQRNPFSLLAFFYFYSPNTCYTIHTIMHQKVSFFFKKKYPLYIYTHTMNLVSFPLLLHEYKNITINLGFLIFLSHFSCTCTKCNFCLWSLASHVIKSSKILQNVSSEGLVLAREKIEVM